MIFEKPNLGVVWALCLVVASGLVLKVFGTDWISGSIALFLCGLALAFCADYFVSRMVRMKIKLYDASQERVKILDRFLLMDPEQRESMEASRIVTEYFFYAKTREERWIFPGQPIERRYYTTQDVIAVWNAATLERFSLVGTWNEGTVRRELCQTMIKFFSACGWCEIPSGNVGPKWIGDGYRRAYEALWQIEAEEPEIGA